MKYPACCPQTNWMMVTPERLGKAKLSPAAPVAGDRGTLLGCTKCDTLWYLKHDQTQLFRVPPDRAPRVTTWAAEPTQPPAAVIDALESIGATRRTRWGAPGQALTFPGRGATRDGRELPRCLLRFQQGPPLGLGYGEVLLASELARLEPSPEAVEPVVRQVTTIEWESGRGLALTPVRAPNGEGLNLNWTVHFFSDLGVLGKDLVLARQTVAFSSEKIFAEDKSSITLVVADWNEEHLRWCTPMPSGIQTWMERAWTTYERTP